MNGHGADETTKPKYPYNVYALEMYQTEDGVDCRIEVCQKDGDGQQEKTEVIKVHKFVLMANSRVFRNMFAHKCMKECREGLIQIGDSTISAVRQMVHFLYTGVLPPDYDVQRDAIPLAHIANKYEIDPLMKWNEDKLVESISLENVLDRLELADLLKLERLKCACLPRIWNNLVKLNGTEKWANLKEAAKGAILQWMADYKTKQYDSYDYDERNY